MKKLKARELMMWSEESVWGLAKEKKILLTFDDGEMEVKGKQTIISWYIWGIHRAYPETPLLKKHHMGNGHLGANTHLKLLTAAINTAFETYPHTDPVGDMEDLSRLEYQITNRIYNILVGNLEKYPTSIQIVDFKNVMRHPKILAANKALQAVDKTSDINIESTYAIVRKVLNDPNEFPDNPVAKAARFGLVRMGQLLQCVSARGQATDIDSNIFRKPIYTGFVEGMRNLEDQMKESRSASKALFFSKGPMADSEYFNRNIQLGAATLRNLHPGDCGSTELINFQVNPGDIPSLVGIYHQAEDGKLRMITNDDHHLVGKIIRIRNVFTCLHPDRYGVCFTCYGQLAYSFPRNSNLGHFASTQLQSKLSQHILSTKHEDTSATVDDIALSEYDRRYVKQGFLKSTLVFTESLMKDKFLMVVSSEAAKSLIDVTHVQNITSLVVSRITELSELQFVIKRPDSEQTVMVGVSSGTRRSSFTHAALEYIKRKGWTFNENGDFVIDMADWNKETPVLEFPLRHYSMVDFMRQVESTIKGSGKKSDKSGKASVKSLVEYNSPEGALSGLHDLVSSKFEFPVSHLQAIVLSTMVESVADRDFNLPKAGSIGEMNTYISNMENRSLSAMMAFQYQLKSLTSLSSFLVTDRPDHPLDDMLLP